MLKSNCNKFREKVRKFIFDGLNFDGYGISPKTDAEKIKALKDIYLREGKPGCRSFSDWLNGLPGVIYVDVSYFEQRERLREWFEESPEESERYSDEKVNEIYLYLIQREFLALCKKYNI